MDVTRRSFGLGFVGALAGLFLRHGAASAASGKTPELQGVEAEERHSVGTLGNEVQIMGKVDSQPYLKAYTKEDGTPGERFFMTIRLRAFEGPGGGGIQQSFDSPETGGRIVPIVAWGDSAKNFYGMVARGILQPGVEVHALGAFHEGDGGWCHVVCDRLAVIRPNHERLNSPA